SFDCYGTLIDWETGLLAVLRPWADRSGLSEVNDTRLLAAFSQLEPIMQSENPTALYPEILHQVMRRLADSMGAVASEADCEALATSVGDWPAFADSPAALSRLQERFKLIIVSNVDRASFARSNERLAVAFDAIIAAEDVGSYKPGPGHFQSAFDWLALQEIERSVLLHVAESLYHDHVPAKALGLRTIWIRRRREGASRATRAPDAPVTPDAAFATLGEFADSILG
ncbi:MAG: HAD-IA family hydrolase, partial [Phycisphaerales bacterium]|nr:HAD-IA family hydrolase [Phycisphaerales bacterium]